MKTILFLLFLQAYIGSAYAADKLPNILNEHNLKSHNNNLNIAATKTPSTTHSQQVPSPKVKTQETVVRAVSTSRMEFKSFIQAEFIKSYAQHQLDHIRASRRPIHLPSLLKKSQEEFLSHDPSSALKTYRTVIDHIHSFDWNEEERKIIFYILFRSAQLESNVEKQKLFLHEAMVFGQGLKLDFSLFPPPLMKAYLNIKKASALVPVNLKKIFPEHELVIINGRVYSANRPVFLPYGVYRVSAFSSSHIPWTKTISLSRLVSQVVHTKPVVSKGNCQQGGKLNAISKGDRAIIKVLFPNFCVWNTAKQTIDKVHFKARTGWQANVFTKDWKDRLSVEKIAKWTIFSSIVALGAAVLVITINDKIVNDRVDTEPFEMKDGILKKDQQILSKPTIQPVIQVGF